MNPKQTWTLVLIATALLLVMLRLGTSDRSSPALRTDAGGDRSSEAAAGESGDETLQPIADGSERTAIEPGSVAPSVAKVPATRVLICDARGRPIVGAAGRIWWRDTPVGEELSIEGVSDVEDFLRFPTGDLERFLAAWKASADVRWSAGIQVLGDDLLDVVCDYRELELSGDVHRLVVRRLIQYTFTVTFPDGIEPELEESDNAAMQTLGLVLSWERVDAGMRGRFSFPLDALPTELELQFRDCLPLVIALQPIGAAPEGPVDLGKFAARTNGAALCIEFKFDDGSPLDQVKIGLFGASGNVEYEGMTDAAGVFCAYGLEGDAYVPAILLPVLGDVESTLPASVPNRARTTVTLSGILWESATDGLEQESDATSFASPALELRAWLGESTSTRSPLLRADLAASERLRFLSPNKGTMTVDMLIHRSAQVTLQSITSDSVLHGRKAFELAGRSSHAKCEVPMTAPQVGRVTVEFPGVSDGMGRFQLRDPLSGFLLGSRGTPLRSDRESFVYVGEWLVDPIDSVDPEQLAIPTGAPVHFTAVANTVATVRVDMAIGGRLRIQAAPSVSGVAVDELKDCRISLRSKEGYTSVDWYVLDGFEPSRSRGLIDFAKGPIRSQPLAPGAYSLEIKRGGTLLVDKEITIQAGDTEVVEVQ